MFNCSIAAISQEAFHGSRKFVHKEVFFTVADQNLLLKITAIAKPVKTNFSDYSSLAFERMSILKPPSSVGAAVKQLDTFICHLKAWERNNEKICI